MTTLSNLRATTSAALRRTPLTLRSILLLLFCGYLLLGPVPNSSDIVAASLAYGLVTIFGVIAGTTLLQAMYIKRRLAIELFPPEEHVVARRAAPCILKFSKVRLIPGMVLEVHPSCLYHGIEIPKIKLFRGTQPNQRIAINVTAPHRGNWDIHGVRCAVGDLTGFIRVAWTIPLDSSLIIIPPTQPDALLPLISSTQRPGDLVSDAVHRLGDPFDIKPYHPSDGVKKIVWKAFAKSGELLSRHAEASMTPEGFVALFVLAQPNDDDVCGKALAYVNALSELKLDLLLSCEGQNGRPPGHNVDTSRELLIDSTWDSLQNSGNSLREDLQALFDACTGTGVSVNLRKIVIFCSGARMASLSGVTLMQSLTQWMEERQIEPVFFLTQPRILPSNEENAWARRAATVLFERESSSEHATSANEYQTFLSTCLAKQWEVFI
jgi:hypothetical protein